MNTDEVLAVLRHLHADWIECDQAQKGEINHDTTLRDWFHLGDDCTSRWATNARLLNTVFEIDAPLSKWKAILTPPGHKTVGDVCRFLASQATVPRLSEVGPSQRSCPAAQVFHTLRALLAQRSVDISGLRPSTPLPRLETVEIPAIHLTLIRLAPRLMPLLSVRYRSDLPFLCLAATSFFAAVAFGVIAVNVPHVGVPGVLLALGAFVGIWRMSEIRAARPFLARFERIGTFGDLCRVIAIESNGHPV